MRAALAVNAELVALYWQIGRLILERQKHHGWGGKVIDRLSVDLRTAFPGVRGFSASQPSPNAGVGVRPRPPHHR